MEGTIIDKQKLGRLFKQIRVIKGLTQEQVSDHFGMGQGNSSISRFESGQKGSGIYDLDKLIQFSGFYQVNLIELLQGRIIMNEDAKSNVSDSLDEGYDEELTESIRIEIMLDQFNSNEKFARSDSSGDYTLEYSCDGNHGFDARTDDNLKVNIRNAKYGYIGVCTNMQNYGTDPVLDTGICYFDSNNNVIGYMFCHSVELCAIMCDLDKAFAGLQKKNRTFQEMPLNLRKRFITKNIGLEVLFDNAVFSGESDDETNEMTNLYFYGDFVFSDSIYISPDYYNKGILKEMREIKSSIDYVAAEFYYLKDNDQLTIKQLSMELDDMAIRNNIAIDLCERLMLLRSCST